MSDLAHRGAVPPDPTRQAAQRLLDGVYDWTMTSAETAAAFASDVRLVAEAVMAQHLPDDRCLAEHGLLKSGVAGEVADLRARSAEGAETCASSGVVYRGARDERPVGWSDADWAGWWMLQPECGEASRAHIERILTGATDLARRGAALQAEVVRLREALEARGAE